jgi:hypothetical protein
MYAYIVVRRVLLFTIPMALPNTYILNYLMVDMQGIRPTCCTHEKYMLLIYVCPHCNRPTYARGPNDYTRKLSPDDLLVYVPRQFSDIKQIEYECVVCVETNTLVYYN